MENGTRASQPHDPVEKSGLFFKGQGVTSVILGVTCDVMENRNQIP